MRNKKCIFNHFILKIIFLSSSFVFAIEPPNDTKFRHWNDTLKAHVTDQWNLAGSDTSIKAYEAWDYTTGSSDVVVAVVDSGFDLNQAELQGAYLRDKYERIISYDAFNNRWGQDAAHQTEGATSLIVTLKDLLEIALNPLKEVPLLGDIVNETLVLIDLIPEDTVVNLGDDLSPHGTRVTEIIAASKNDNTGIAGIAGDWELNPPLQGTPGVKILPIKYWPDYLSLTSAFLITTYFELLPPMAQGIKAAADNGADVINLSLSAGIEALPNMFQTPLIPMLTNIHFGYYSIGNSEIRFYDATVKDAIKYAYNKGCVIATTAGNSNHIVSLPGRDKRTICTAAGDKNEKKLAYIDIGFGASYGSEIDIIAPGNDVWTTNPSGMNNYCGTFGLNSAAVPHTSGVAALVLSILPKDIRYTNPNEADPMKRIHKDGIQEIVRCILTESSNKNLVEPDLSWKIAYKLRTGNDFSYHGEGWLDALEAVKMAREYDWKSDVFEVKHDLWPDSEELNTKYTYEDSFNISDQTYQAVGWYYVDNENSLGVSGTVTGTITGNSLTVRTPMESSFWLSGGVAAHCDMKVYLISKRKNFLVTNPFTDTVNNDTTKPATPTLTEPIETKIMTTKPILKWSSVEDEASGLSHYEMELTSYPSVGYTLHYSSPIGALLKEGFNDASGNIYGYLNRGWKNLSYFVPTIQDGEFSISGSSPKNRMLGIYNPGLGKDLEITAKVTIKDDLSNEPDTGSGIFVHGYGENSGVKWALCFRFDNSGGNYKLALLEDAVGLNWAKEEGQTEGEVNFPDLTKDTSYWLKLKVIGNRIYGKAWKADNGVTPEPGWMVKAMFSPNDYTAVGVFTHKKKTSFDDITVKPVEKLFDYNFNSIADNNAPPYNSWRPTGNWFVENKEYVAATRKDPGRYSFTSSAGENYNWKDYSASVRVKPVEENWQAGLLVKEIYYVQNFYLLQSNKDYLWIKKWKDNQQVTDFGGVIPLAKLGLSSLEQFQWHTLRIDGVGSKICFYLNNKLVAAVDDPDPLRIGNIGIKAESTTGNQNVEIHFDDMIVERLNADPSYTITENLLPGSTYWWHARAVDMAGNPGDWSDTRWFLIREGAPDVTSSMTPANGQILTDSNVDFNWNDTVLPGGHYQLQVATSSDFGNALNKSRYEDHFDSATLDTAVWNVVAGNCQLESGALSVEGASNEDAIIVTKGLNFGNDYKIQCKMNIKTGAANLLYRYRNWDRLYMGELTSKYAATGPNSLRIHKRFTGGGWYLWDWYGSENRFRWGDTNWDGQYINKYLNYNIDTNQNYVMNINVSENKHKFSLGKILQNGTTEPLTIDSETNTLFEITTPLDEEFGAEYSDGEIGFRGIIGGGHAHFDDLIIESKSTIVYTHAYSTPLANGQYYWRVRAVDVDSDKNSAYSEWSSPQSFSVNSETTPHDWGSFVSYNMSYAPVQADENNDSVTPTCAVPVYCGGSGLNISSAKAYYSINSGGDWSQLTTSVYCTGIDSTTEFVTISASNVPFNQVTSEPGLNQMKFEINNMLGTEFESSSYEVKISTIDETAPSPVTNIIACRTNQDFTSVILRWVAPGDDGEKGIISGGKYTIKWSTEPVVGSTATWWNNAEYTQETSTNAIPGNFEITQITGLSANLTYYFALRTADEKNNLSEISVARKGGFYYGGSLAGIKDGYLAFGDYNNDEWIDLAICGECNNIYEERLTHLYKNVNGNFVLQPDSNLVAIDTGSLTWCDYDNDGDLDLLVSGNVGWGTGSGGAATQLYRNDNGVFFNSEQYIQHQMDGGVGWGDYNNDGYKDLLVVLKNGTPPANQYPSRFYRNNKGVLIEDTNLGMDDLKKARIGWADIDNDGDQDLIVCGETTQSYGQMTNICINENGTFISSSMSVTAVSEGSLAFGDYNNDGWIDLAICGTGAGYPDKYLKIYKNINGWYYADNYIQLTGIHDNFGGLAWCDYNNDGYLDLIVTGVEMGYTCATRIYKNNNDESFTEDTLESQFLPKVSEASLVAGDINGDNNPDLVVAGEKADGYRYTEIYMNSPWIKNTAPNPPASGFETFYSSGMLTFKWSAGSDNETPAEGLYYNVRVGTTTGGNQVLSGAYGSPLLGNSLQAKISPAQHGIKLFLDENVTYYWSVQTIDTGLAKSAWSTEQVALPNLAPGRITGLGVIARSNDSVTLSWINAGDDEYYGQITGGKIKMEYADNPEYETSSLLTVSTTCSAGSISNYKIQGRSPATAYYFRVSNADEANNYGEWSETTSTTTYNSASITSSNETMTIFYDNVYQLETSTSAFIEAVSTVTGKGQTAAETALSQNLKLFSGIYEVKPESSTFSLDNILKLSYDAVKITSGTQEDEIYIYKYYPATGWSLTPVLISSNSAENWIQVQIASAGIYAMLAPIDATAPGDVASLDVESWTGHGAVVLGWAAPGDDGTQRQLNNAKWLIQYATDSEITWSTASAQVVVSTGGINPNNACRYFLDKLTGGVTYYFKLWTQDEAGNCSQASNMAQADTYESPYVVTNSSDDGTGSLRWAINNANNSASETIGFAIPESDSGYDSGRGVWRIAPLTELPVLMSSGTKIDGTTQATYGGNTNIHGPEIELWGGYISAAASGVSLSSNNITITGLIISSFTENGIELTENSWKCIVNGNYVGLNSSGTFSIANGGNGIKISGSSNTIGGTTEPERNIIAGNTGSGIALEGSYNNILNNYVGTGLNCGSSIPNGTSGNSDPGIKITGDASYNTIDGNIVSGNTNSGIEISAENESDSAAGNVISDNYIGLNSTGCITMPNHKNGVEITGSSSNTVQGNTIANNGDTSEFSGVYIHNSKSTGNKITINTIKENNGLGIRLADNANCGITPPWISTAVISVINGTAPVNSTVELFVTTPAADSSGCGEGGRYLFSVNTSSLGYWSANALNYVKTGDTITVTATDTGNNTSEFSLNVFVSNIIPPSAITDLIAAAGTAHNEIALGWTSPGNDGMSGSIPSGQFKIQYSTITDISWNKDDAQMTVAESIYPYEYNTYSLTGLTQILTYYFRIWTVDESSNSSAVSNEASSIPQYDNTSPAKITGFSVETATQLKLCWTSPGDDSWSNTISNGKFEINYSTDSLMNSAATVIISTSVEANISVNYVLTGLEPSATYYVVIRTADEVPNYSEWSDTVTAIAGSFYEVWTSSEYDPTSTVCWGDYNNDGYIDQLTGNFGTPVSVLRNDGSGNFVTTWISTVSQNAVSAQWTDFDNDGKQDILVINYSQPLRIYKNIGNNIFTLFWQSPNTENTYNAAICDFDNDGLPDILAANFLQPARLYRNNSTCTQGSFTSAWISPDTYYTTCIAAGDYNNDGYMDIYMGNYGQAGRLYENNGNNTFTACWSADANNSTAVYMADTDNDGKPDIIECSSSSVKLYLNNGGANFSLAWVSNDVNQVTGISAGDYNNDGRTDLLVSCYSGENKVYSNNGDNTFTCYSAGDSKTSKSNSFGDFDNDGDLDYVTGNSNYHRNTVYKSLEAEYGSINTAPVAPASGFTSSYSTGTGNIELRWSDASDTETPADGLSYEVRIATEEIADNLTKWMMTPNPHGFAGSGQPGINFDPPIENTSYFWQVRTVDSGLKRSSWSAENAIYVSGTAPAVSVLTVVDRTTNTIALGWTSAGDDGNIGYLSEGSKFEIKYSTESLMNQATTVEISTAVSAQTGQAYKITGINPYTTYFTKLRTEDNKGNWSDWSDILSTCTYHGVEKSSGTEKITVFYDSAELEGGSTSVWLQAVSVLSAKGVQALNSASATNITIDGALFEVLPESATLNSVSEITLKYNDSKIPNDIPEADLNTWRYSPSNGWESVAGRLLERDTVNNLIKVNVSSTGLYAVLSEKDTTAPGIITDLSAAADIHEGEMNLSWTAPGDDNLTGTIEYGQYKIQYSADSEITWSTGNAQVTISTTNIVAGTRPCATITGLTGGTTYFVRIWTADEAVTWSGLSNSATGFAQAPDITSPSAPELISPADHYCVLSQCPGFSWNSVTDISTPVKYELQMADNADFNSPVIDTTTWTAVFTTTIPVNQGIYYWRVKAKDANNNIGSWSDTYDLKITTDSISLSNPANNVILNTSSPTLSWGQITDYSGITYELSIIGGGDSITGLTATSYSHNALVDGTYMWQVRAKDTLNNYRYSSYGVFTIDTSANVPVVWSYVTPSTIMPDETCTIYSSLSDRSHISMWISSTTLVRNLSNSNEWRSNGSTSAVWNAQDNNGTRMDDADYTYNILGVNYNNSMNSIVSNGLCYSQNTLWATGGAGAELNSFNVYASSCLSSFNLPDTNDTTGMVTDSAGNIYFCAKDEGKIYRYDTDYSTSEVIGAGLYDIAVDANDTYLYAVGDYDKVVRLTVADPPSDPADIIASGLNNPRGIAVDSSYLYVLDSGNNLIKKYLKDSPYTLQWFAGTGLNNPRGIKVYKDYLFVCNSGSNEIQVYSKNDGKYIDKFGSTGSTSEQLNNPVAILVYPGIDNTQNYLFVADNGNSRIQRYSINIATGMITLHTDNPYTVMNSSQTGPWSLSWCITNANSHPNNIIGFNIPTTDSSYDSDTGVWTINLSTPLPAITGAGTYIYGASQTVNQGNTNPDGPEIELNGSSIDWIDSSQPYGIDIAADNVAISNLAVGYFPSDGIHVNSGADNCTIKGCYVGIDPHCTALRSNGAIAYYRAGIYVEGANALIGGGTSWDDANVISYNYYCVTHGLVISGVNCSVLYNYIGTTPDDILALNSGNGIYVTGNGYNAVISSNVISCNYLDGIKIGDNQHNVTLTGNWIGTDKNGNAFNLSGNVSNGITIGDTAGASTNTVTSNVIANNYNDGIQVRNTASTGNNLSKNRIFNNGGEAIDLGNDGIGNTTKVNGGTAVPWITYADVGVITGTAPANSSIEVFVTSDSAESNGYGEAKIYVGTASASGSGYWELDLPAIGYIIVNDTICATATTSSGNTSELGYNYKVVYGTLSASCSPTMISSLTVANIIISANWKQHINEPVTVTLSKQDEISRSYTTNSSTTTSTYFTISTGSIKTGGRFNLTVAATNYVTYQSSIAVLPGLNAVYYNAENFTGVSVSSINSTINYDWAYGAPISGIIPDEFSVRWVGKVIPDYSELYTFYTNTDDGARLWVNGKLLIDKWQDQGATEYSSATFLTAGHEYSLQMEYYDSITQASAQLMWSSTSTSKQVIPQSKLFQLSSCGDGLQASYFIGTNSSGTPVVTGFEPQVNFDWGSSAPHPNISSDNFSARWLGQVKADYSDTYTFYADVDDGVRLWINNQRVINAWTDGAKESSGTISLAAGTKYDLKMEYYDYTSSAKAILKWSCGSLEKQVIPQYNLYSVNSSSGDGLTAEYYDNKDFTGISVKGRVDPQVNFNWATGSPHPSIGNDTFSARWIGQVRPDYSQAYTFYTNTDDGVRLWIDGKLAIDKWQDQTVTEYSTTTVTLTAGTKYNIQMEYYENANSAQAELRWQSSSVPKQLIPQANLYSTLPGGDGLNCAYYNNTKELRGTPVTGFDPKVDFAWGSGAPRMGIGSDTFSARWWGQVKADYSETYTFYLERDDGARLWVNDQLVINAWTDGSTESSGAIALTAGVKYNIRLEYYEGCCDAKLKLKWSSNSVTKAAIPQANLYTSYSGGDGLNVTYYDNDNFTGTSFSCIVSSIDVDWGNGSPDSTIIGPDSWSARYTGYIKPEYSETYTFYAYVDDRVKLYIDGNLVIDYWASGGRGERTGTTASALTAGKKHTIQVDYREDILGALFGLSWSSNSRSKQVIPRERLYSDIGYRSAIVRNGKNEPSLMVEQNILDFGKIDKNAVYVTKQLKISNEGIGTLKGNITTDKNWITVDKSDFEITVDSENFTNNSMTINVTVDNNILKTKSLEYKGNINITSNGGVMNVVVNVEKAAILTIPNPYNPFRGVLTFFGSAIVPLQTTIKIYSLSGDLVNVITETTIGDITDADIMKWNGRDKEGRVVPSGIYLYTFENRKEKGIGKFTVIR